MELNNFYMKTELYNKDDEKNTLLLFKVTKD